MLVIAHRGASGHAPENTMAAFRLALSMGAKAVELDVHQTKDGALVVIHDEDLKRTGGRKLRVKDLTYKELCRHEVGSWFDGAFHGEPVPLLEEVFELCRGKAEVHVELKRGSALYPGIEDKVAALVRRRKAWDTTLFSSFDHHALYGIRWADSRARIGYLLGLTLMRTAYREMGELKAESLNLSRRQVDARKVKACHDRGLKVLVYTVNDAPELERLDKLGVDGVFCNYPELAR